MNCRDFERLWNARLDARALPDAAAERALEAHAADCPGCRGLGASYQAIGLMVSAWPDTLPPPGFADRVLAAAARLDAVPAGPWSLPARSLVSLAAAAALVAALTLGLRGWTTPGPRDGLAARRAPGPAVRPIDPDRLSAALADATTATLLLAREASAPAARVGGDVLGGAELSLSAGTDALGSAGPGVMPASASAVWQGVEDRVNAGVRPLSGTARSAFSFLLPRTPAGGDPRNGPSRTPAG